MCGDTTGREDADGLLLLTRFFYTGLFYSENEKVPLGKDCGTTSRVSAPRHRVLTGSLACNTAMPPSRGNARGELVADVYARECGATT